MRRYAQRSGLTTLSEINITPLLDLAFVLLIIFIITTPLFESSANLQIPRSAAPGAPLDPAGVQIVSLDRDGVLRLQEEAVTTDILVARLAAIRQSNPEVAVVIRPDRALPVQKLVNVMDAVAQAGVAKVGIATTTAETAP